MTTDHYTQHRDAARANLAALEARRPQVDTEAEHAMVILAIAQVHATLALAAATHDELLTGDLHEFDGEDDPDTPVPYLPNENGQDQHLAEREWARLGEISAQRLQRAYIEIARLTGTSEAVVEARLTGPVL